MMKKFYAVLVSSLLTPLLLLAQEVQDRPMTTDEKINSFFQPITTAIESVVFFTVSFGGFTIPFVLVWLIAGAAFFTIYMGFVNIRAFRHSIDVVRGKYDDPNDSGEVSHFQALTAALSGTVGVGNIAGVAIAVSLGGPGATFWMIVAGLLGMSSKFVECSLGVMYRNINPDGSVSGGPMYYMDKGFREKGPGWAVVGKILAVMFAIACVGGSFGGGNMVQVNQATQQLIAVTGGENSFLAGQGWIFGAVMAGLVAIIILGGIKSIARVTDKLVPGMVGIYVLAALIILIYHIGDIPAAFGKILSGAFNADALYGGLVGVLIQGFRRAAFSNEAGVGSASIAHSAVKTDEPISEGVVSLLEPFIDTVVICTMTALVIVVSDYGSIGAEAAYQSFSTGGGNEAAIALTSSAFEQTISWFPIILSIAVILFALSTMISWSYYGLKSWTYLFGETKLSENIFKTLFCIFVIIGSAISARSVFDFGDAMIFAMCFPNVLALYVLIPKVKEAYKKYTGKIKSGEIAMHD
ncbi:MAG TPA: alanine/glycine:cation symporter family protein [Saprospiraceae bacterium]|nr:alanine/glycine:cation symporter family protein [Saprospiraceae bacterium]HMQ84821.1 alanine/glycine:cation symporter family protein [Saprospiraceae bacterium]